MLAVSDLRCAATDLFAIMATTSFATGSFDLMIKECFSNLTTSIGIAYHGVIQ
jgi:hypothetical protein